MKKNELKFNVAPINFREFEYILQKYHDQINRNQNDIDELLDMWNTVIYSSLIPLIMTSPTKFLSPPDRATKFLTDCLTLGRTSLSIAWALGREYAEVDPTNAKRILVIKDYESSLLLPVTKGELLRLADNAGWFLITTLIFLYENNEFDETTLVPLIEENQMIFRSGVLYAFKAGITNYYLRG